VSNSLTSLLLYLLQFSKEIHSDLIFSSFFLSFNSSFSIKISSSPHWHKNPLKALTKFLTTFFLSPLPEL
jgi:hypothetical protein